MTMDRHISDVLRQRAREQIDRENHSRVPVEDRDLERLVEELKVQHVELELQNEDLIASQLQLEEARDRFRDLYDLAPSGYLTLDPRGRIQDVNQTAASMFGREASQLVRRPFSEFLDQADADEIHRRRQEMARASTAGIDEMEVTLRPAEGRELVVLLRLKNKPNPLGPSVRIAMFDLSERSRMEEEIRRAQKMEAVGRLASGIAHDFNNLLMGIAGSQRLAIGQLDETHPAVAELRLGLEATLRGVSLTRQLLDFSDMRRTPPKGIVLDDVVGTAGRMLRRLLGNEIDLVVETGAPGICVLAEAGDIEQVLLNLATNARDSMPRGGILTIWTSIQPRGDTSDDRHEVVLAVRDSGSGMDARTRDRVFEPFYTTKEPGKGTGLGLSSVYGVVQRLAGRMRLESEIDRGTTLWIHLPVASPEKGGVHGVAAEPSAPSPKGMILVFEADPLVGRAVEQSIHELGFTSLRSVTPDQAEADCITHAEKVSFLLAGIPLSATDLDLLNAFRERCPGVPIVYMSSLPRETLVAAGRLPPGAILLQKPFGAEQLRLALTSLEQPRTAPAPASPEVRAVTSRGVVIVDDDVDLASILGRHLQLAGYEVWTRHDIPGALEAVRSHRPRMVLCDLGLGAGQSGHQVAEAIRKDADLVDIQLVALTGRAGSETAAAARDAGFDRTLTKPIDPDVIVALLKEGAQAPP